MSFLHQLTPILFPFLILMALALAAPIVREGYRILRAARVRLRSRAAQAALDALTVVVGTAVAAAASEVRDLKDPTKPGSWNAAVARSIRERVIEEVMLLGRDLIAQLRVIGAVDPEAVYELLERMVEAQVERLRRLDPSSSPTPLLSADLEEPRPTMAPSPLRASTIAVGGAPPPPSPSQRGTVRFGAVAVLLALGLGALALGAVLTGCEPIREGVMRITPGVPSPSPCVPDTQRCEGAVPEVCSQSSMGHTRWWPSLPLRADGTQRVCAGGCSVSDAGIAGCDPVTPAASLPDNPFAAADGGTR